MFAQKKIDYVRSRTRKYLTAIIVIVIAVVFSAIAVSAQGPTGGKKIPSVALGTGFTYQGQLKKNGSNVTSSCNMVFGLWDAAGSGSPPAGGTLLGFQTINSVSVSNGLFTVTLNGGGEFGANAFNGDARWLQIATLCAPDSSSTTLSPRQPLTATPYARFSAAPWVTTSGGDIYYLTAFPIAGNVGIGQPPLPGAKLDVRGNIFVGLTATNDIAAAADNDLFIGNDGGTSQNSFRLDGFQNNLYIVARSGAGSTDGAGIVFNTATAGGGETERMAITPNGYVGIGTTSPRGKLQVLGDMFVGYVSSVPLNSQVGDNLYISNSGGDGNNNFRLDGFQDNLYIVAHSNGDSAAGAGIVFRTALIGGGETDQMRIYPDGNVNIGGTGGFTEGFDKLQVFGEIRTGTSGLNGCVRNFSGGAIAGTCSSDVRLKKNIAAFPNVLDKVTQLQPVYYNWRADEYPDYHFDGSTRSYGVIAQEVERVLPELVSSDERGFKTVNYSEIPLLLLQALKDLRVEKDAEIQNLKSQNAKSQSEIDDLKTRVTALEHAVTKATSVEANGVTTRAEDATIPTNWLLFGGLIVAGFAFARRRA